MGRSMRKLTPKLDGACAVLTRRRLAGKKMQLLAPVVVALTLGACSSDGTSSMATLSAANPVGFMGSCDDLLANLPVMADTTLETSSEVPAGELSVGGQGVAAHCLVTGKMFERISEVDGNGYAISFEMRMPKDWNGRFFHQGNGGIDGSVRTAEGATGGGPLTHALGQGFAVLSSDAGHSSRGPGFGFDPQARLDYGYQATQKLTPMAKALIAGTYGKAPDRSYFGGCSNGGRHTFNAFTRMPGEYDGYLAGAPGYNLPKAAVANILGAQRYAAIATDATDLSTAFTMKERTLLVGAVLNSCDSLDGLADGIVGDVDACQVDFSLDDVATCDAGRDGSCLSGDQKTAIGAVFSGENAADGTPVYAAFAFDAGTHQSSNTGWEFEMPISRDSGAVGQVFGTPPQPNGFGGADFVLNTSLEDLVASINATTALYTESGMQFMTPPNPTSLSAVRDRGAKIMVYHGVSDPIFSALDSVAWIDGVQAEHSDAMDFAHLYLVPGMGHCRGGPATDQFDMLTELVTWVEQGVAPEQVVATARGVGNAGEENTELPADWSASRTRPLCAYPRVATYDGSGDVEVASSFSCQ